MPTNPASEYDHECTCVVAKLKAELLLAQQAVAKVEAERDEARANLAKSKERERQLDTACKRQQQRNRKWFRDKVIDWIYTSWKEHADRLKADLAAKDQQLARIKAAADADEVDLNTMRDGSKLTRHGLVQTLEYWREEVAAKDAEIATLKARNATLESGEWSVLIDRDVSGEMAAKDAEIAKLRTACNEGYIAIQSVRNGEWHTAEYLRKVEHTLSAALGKISDAAIDAASPATETSVSRTMTEERKPHCKVASALRTAIAIIRNDSGSPLHDHDPTFEPIRRRWCEEMIAEAGIEPFDDRDYPPDEEDGEEAKGE